MKLSQVKLRLHNPGIEGTGSGIKGHPKASHKNPGHHGCLEPEGDLKVVSNTEMHNDKSIKALDGGLGKGPRSKYSSLHQQKNKALPLRPTSSPLPVNCRAWE